MGEASQNGRARRRLFVVAGVLVAIVIGALLVERGVNGAAEAPGGAPAAKAYGVSVEQGGKVLRTFSVQQLHSLPQTHVTSDGKAQAGPSLPAVLAAAGVTGAYSALEIRGMGLRDGGRLTLPAGKVNARVILDFSDRGTMKIVSPQLDFGERVRDVTAIVVR
jgi:hypothetical protein